MELVNHEMSHKVSSYLLFVSRNTNDADNGHGGGGGGVHFFVSPQFSHRLVTSVLSFESFLLKYNIVHFILLQCNINFS